MGRSSPCSRQSLCAWLRSRSRAIEGDAEAAIDTSAEKYGIKYGEAAACLVRGRDALLAIFGFRAPSTHGMRHASRITSQPTRRNVHFVDVKIRIPRAVVAPLIGKRTLPPASGDVGATPERR